MKKTYWLLPAFALAALQAHAAPPAPKPAPVAGDKPSLVCFIAPSTGSHIKKKVCMTEAEHAARKAADQDAMMKLKAGGAAEKTKSGFR